MNKNINILFVFILLALLAGGFFVFSRGHKLSPKAKEQFILFYSQTCPHCQKVEKYINGNQAAEKLPIEEKNISQPANRNELIKYAQKCGLATDRIGVPLLFDGQRCLVGDQEIISFLRQKLNDQSNRQKN